MNKSSLPPPHPSLPRPPIAAAQTQSLQPHRVPYPANHAYSSHYAQAYYSQMSPQSAPATSSVVLNGKGTPAHLMSTWYQAGNIRCSYPGCKFQGSHKSIELHKMDRHLIYPPEWEKRKKKSEWDADPSLKGKPIPIQGTSVTLDTPELIDAWIAERKNRFPTTSRSEEKKRKMAEAVERGQLDLNPSRHARPPKRRKIDPRTDGAEGHASHVRGKSIRGRKSNASQGRRDSRKDQKSAPEPHIVPAALRLLEKDQESDDDDAAPEELSSKMPDLAENVHVGETALATPPACPKPARPQGWKEPKPRGPPKNPFASRPALLRNLLLPEIRMTVSNLSQAIRFLVDNDFLRNVELQPGQAIEQQKIHVLSSEESSIT